MINNYGSTDRIFDFNSRAMNTMTSKMTAAAGSGSGCCSNHITVSGRECHNNDECDNKMSVHDDDVADGCGEQSSSCDRS